MLLPVARRRASVGTSTGATTGRRVLGARRRRTTRLHTAPRPLVQAVQADTRLRPVRRRGTARRCPMRLLLGRRRVVTSPRTHRRMINHLAHRPVNMAAEAGTEDRLEVGTEGRLEVGLRRPLGRLVCLVDLVDSRRRPVGLAGPVEWGSLIPARTGASHRMVVGAGISSLRARGEVVR